MRILQTMTAERNHWPGQATREDRQKARRNIVLADVGVSPTTLQRYYFAVGRLRHVLAAVTNEVELDEFIAEWVQAEFEDGTPLYLVADALSGLHHLEPFTRRKLVKSWRLYGIWRKYEIPARAPPITQDLVVAMAGWCLQHDELAMGALLLLGFHALLRTGELLQVRPCDFLLGETSGIVSLQSSKSGLRFNSKESVSLHDMYTIELVRALIDLRRSQDLLNVPCWVQSGTSFRTLFSRILSELQISHLSFRPYSLRRGGATLEMQTHGLMEKTLLRGRWKNSAVARLYICDGLSMLPRLTMTWTAKQLVARFSAVLTAEHRCFNNGVRGKKRRRGNN